MSYPANDSEFSDKTIDKVESNKRWHTITCDGWSMSLPKDCPIVPEVGQTARFYGKGLGYNVRGLFVDGKEAWYRTEAEENEYRAVSLYGKDAGDWLKRWDEGDTVWSIEMGGFGPGYEQALQVAAAEMVRWFLARNMTEADWKDETKWKEIRDAMEEDLAQVDDVQELDLSGNQWAAATYLAAQICQRGPRALMEDENGKDRHIQVSKYFPGKPRPKPVILNEIAKR